MNNNINNTGQQLLTLFVPIFVIASLSFLVLVDNTWNDVYAQTTISNTTITTTPATKTFQNPIDAKTGQEIVPPTSTFVEIDKETGQPSKISDVYQFDVLQKDPIIQGQSAEKTTAARPTPYLPTQFGSQLDQFQILQPDGIIQDPIKLPGSKIAMQDPMTGQVIIREFTLSNILNDTNEVIDWIPYDSVIAVKVVNSSNEDLSANNWEIMVTAFMNNKDTVVATWFPVGFGLYKFVHIPHNQWQPPATTVDVKLIGPQNYTKSSMCNTYIELGKLYKCNITVK